MNKTAWKLVLVALLYVTAGCATGSVQTARTNGAGNFQFAVEPGIIGIGSTVGTVIVPSFNIAGRYGVTDSVDIGARIGSVSYEIQAKIMFTDPNDYEGMAISIAPQVTAIGAGAGGTSFFLVRTAIPLLFGLSMGDSELVFGPRISPWFFGGGGGGAGSAGGLALFVGGEIGYALRVGDKFWILPHVSFDYPVLAVVAAGGSSASGSLGEGLLFGAGVGLLFGGRPAQAP